jgi:hypothetical protein
MSLSTYDDFLGAIAHQARVAYATQQMHACQKAFEHRQAQAAFGASASDNPRVRHELTYYTAQVARWQDYLERLRADSNAVASVQTLMELDLPPCG